MGAKSYNHLVSLLKTYKDDDLKKALADANFHDIARLINKFTFHKVRLFKLLSPAKQAEVIVILNKRSQKILLQSLSLQEIAEFLKFNDEDDVLNFLQEAPADEQHQILNLLQQDKRKRIARLVEFDRDTAGRLVDFNYITIKDEFTLRDIADKIQRHIDSSEQVPHIIVMKDKREIAGYIPHKNLILSSPDTPAMKLVQKMPLVKHTVKQDRLTRYLTGSKSSIIGVVDSKKELLGVIKTEEIIALAQAQTTRKIYQFAGVQREETLYDTVRDKVSNRYQWLVINLGTAFLASSVVGMFQDSIARVAILAVYMPIVAGQGGNAATQALAVTVRGIATDEISWPEAKDIVIKESVAGMVNGLIVGFIAAFAAFFFGSPMMLGVVLAIAMIANLFVAGLCGALIPFILKSMKIDPAVASTVFVTTATDVVGFFVFLSLGSILL